MKNFPEKKLGLVGKLAKRFYIKYKKQFYRNTTVEVG